MKYVLDLKDYVTKLDSEEKDYNENFYRYYVLDCNDERVATVWFSQKEDSGNIYTISVRLLSKEFDGFDIFVTDEGNEREIFRGDLPQREAWCLRKKNQDERQPR